MIREAYQAFAIPVRCRPSLHCKAGNQRWPPNYSSVLDDLTAGGLSAELYIPERDRHGAALTFENAGIALGTSVAINVLQEFALHRLTSRKQ
jgi:hypothetical protein